jgi:hypothetical protein
MSPAMSPGPATPSEELWQGAGQRMEATLRALGIPPDGVGPLPAGFPLPAPGPAGQERLRRGFVILAVPPGADVFALAAALWRQGHCQVSESHTASGRTLTAHDPAGYLLTLTSGDRISLVVASPPAPCRRVLGLVLGIVAGVLLSPAASCFSFVSALDSTFREGAPPGGFLLAWAWAPVLLVIGGLLLVPSSTRRFGIGLMIGGAVTGLAVSGFLMSLIT